MDKICQIPQLSFGNKDAGMVGIWTKASILEHRHTVGNNHPQVPILE